MDLFVYGTLRAAALLEAVAGRPVADAQHATLDGFAVRPLAGDVVPVILPDPQSVAEGLLLRGLDDGQMARLDLYEGAFGYVLKPVRVNAGGQACDAMCYFPDDSLQAGPGAWSLADWEAAHLAPGVIAATELFRHDPLPDYATLRRMWPMIQSRAWARHRATAAPATLRTVPQGADVTIENLDPPLGGFFRFQRLDISHKRFDGARSDVLSREVFVGIDAAVVLPYDPVRDKVLLTEQIRMGPVMRHDPNPWMLEPVAGIIDARETPQDAAFREAREEAGLELHRLVPAGEYYSSPGAVTEHIFAFVGLCDLPQDQPWQGGMPDEGEDIRLHPMTFDAAMALAASGEIATGPTLHLLYWLAYHRDSLRAAA